MKCLLGLLLIVVLTGCQTSYYPPTDTHATKDSDGMWRGGVKKEGVPDWSPKSFNIKGAGIL